MNEAGSAQQRESDNSYINNSNGDSSMESYQQYARSSLPEGYTRYNETAQNVYDQYDSDYRGAETPDQGDGRSCTSTKSYCKIGRLWNIISCYSMRLIFDEESDGLVVIVN